MFGKDNVRDVYDILSERGFNNKLGIRDSDFLRIQPNPKYKENYDKDIFITDHHDAEMMIAESQALENFILTTSNDEKVSSFEKNIELTIRELLYGLLYQLGCLKLANKRHKLGLYFKPKDPDGNKIKYKNIVCVRTFKTTGIEALVRTIIQYSNDKGDTTASKDEIIEKLNSVISENHPPTEIINGHDLAEVLLIICKKGLKSKKKFLQDSASVEDSLAMSFDSSHFSKTNLYSSLIEWEKRNKTHILNKELFGG